ncbi:Retrovirus-related Pol polyprotein from transposon TNT 1-94 [Gossypium australe]|uniref:Retrovirus-related Pol polyprotein from transposon TNT 1-94 n=1 Tax=Gossypium australe TaxID=47621 RepID=A0A5B6WQT3_9ROSI|nr:Retrovirus-related Pol polyprotein from transposon TNT 1-94 [Gossypium australe]
MYNEPFQLIVLDLWGPSPYFSYGYQYYLSFVDAFSRYTWIIFLKKKSNALNRFILFKKQVKLQFRYKIKQLQTDGGASSSLDHWYDAFSLAVFLINQLPTIALDGVSPFEKHYGQQPDYTFLKVCGCLFPLRTDSLLPYLSSSLSQLVASVSGSSSSKPIGNIHPMVTRSKVGTSSPRLSRILMAVCRYKARLVVQGYFQTIAYNFQETFNLVIKANIVRTILALVVANQWQWRQVDVNNFFLNGDLYEDVYMKHLLVYMDDIIKYVIELLERTGMSGAKSVPTPMKQGVASRSTLKAEYRILANATSKMLWFV